MTRPLKNNADYFTHDNDMRNNKRIKALRRAFSHVGFSVWNMLLESLCYADNFQLEYTEESIELLAGDFDIEPQKLTEILAYLIKIKLLNVENSKIFNSTMITRFEVLFRKRKRDSERLSPAITPYNGVIVGENREIKEKKIKEKKRVQKKSKKDTPEFLENFNQEKKRTTAEMKEKKTGVFSLIHEGSLQHCQELFLQHAPKYLWEVTDKQHLEFLLQKILKTKTDIFSEADLYRNFSGFLAALPDYWKSKKFTVPQLNLNFNEIINEMLSQKSKQQTTKTKQIPPPHTEKPMPKTPQQLQKERQEQIQIIDESIAIYRQTGNSGYVPLWLVYDFLTKEKALLLTPEQLEELRQKAIRERKKQLKNPINKPETQAFKILTEQYKNGNLPEKEIQHIEAAVKSLAVLQFYTRVIKSKKPLNHFLNHE